MVGPKITFRLSCPQLVLVWTGLEPIRKVIVFISSQIPQTRKKIDHFDSVNKSTKIN